MHVKQALSIASKVLFAQPTAELDAQVLLAFCLNKSRTWLFTWPECELNNEQMSRFQQLIERRAEGEPIAYITGSREFWGLSLSCDPSTLIPRADTEVLVERVLQLTLPEQARVVDLGTGTGAIALALASEKPMWQVLAIDYSTEAVQLAQRNAQALSLAVDIRQGDWLQGCAAASFDLIVANPPYIDPIDGHLSQGDVAFEPKSALVAANHGLADIEQIIQQAELCLADNGWLVFEHGYDQKIACEQLIQQSNLHYQGCKTDYAGNDRISLAQKVAR